MFNGDADGICALHQYRLKSPCSQAQLITGVKRDINLLAKLPETSHSQIQVFDISLDKNRSDLEELLASENSVFYVDHHYSGDIPESERLEAHLDPQPQTCASLIMDTLLQGAYGKWAVVGAFGDNLNEVAEKKSLQLGLNATETANLKETGMLLNYNGYGAKLEDLYFSPAELYLLVHPYQDPLVFHAECPAIATLRQGYTSDMEQAQGYSPILEDSCCRIFQLPSAPWARRVAGVFSNMLAREKPEKAHGLLTLNSDKSYRISVRAPLTNRTGADTLCRKFPSGGGRAAAAGVNQLPAEMLDDFMETFSDHFSSL